MNLKRLTLIPILLTVLYGLADTPVPLQVWRTNGVVASPTNFWRSNVIAGPYIELTPTSSNITIGVTGVVSGASSSLTNALLHAGPTNGSVSPLILTAGDGVTLTTSGTNRVVALSNSVLSDVVWTNDSLFIWPRGTPYPGSIPGPPFFFRTDGSLFIGTNIAEDFGVSNYTRLRPFSALSMLDSNQPARIVIELLVNDNSNEYDLDSDVTFQVRGDEVDGFANFSGFSYGTNGNRSGVQFMANPSGSEGGTKIEITTNFAPVFKVVGNGNISVIKGVAGYVWPSAHAAGALTNDGSGNLGWGSSGSSQTPWTSDINAAAFSLTNAGSILVTNITLSGILSINSGVTNSIDMLDTNGTTRTKIYSQGGVLYSSASPPHRTVEADLWASLTNIAITGALTNLTQSPLASGQLAITNGNTTPSRGFKSLQNGANITLTDQGTNIIITASSSGSQTPWTSDIDAAGFALINAGSILVTNITVLGVGINANGSSFPLAADNLIAGGENHTISAGVDNSVILGGFQNSITTGDYSAIVGGDRNVIATNAVTAFIGGGQQNRVTYNSGAISGFENAVDGDNSFIAAGNQNLISANAGRATILSSDSSSITGPGGGDYYCILPGYQNNIPYALSSDDFCYILGGQANRVTKKESWAIGMFLTNSAANQIELGYYDFDKVRIDTNRLHLIGNMQLRMTNGATDGYVLTSTNGGNGVWMPTATDLTKQIGSAALTNISAGANITNISHSPLQAGEIAITNGGLGLDRGLKSFMASTMITLTDEGTNIIVTGTGQTGSAALTNVAAGANVTNLSHSPLAAGQIAITNGSAGLDRGMKSLQGTAGETTVTDQGTNIVLSCPGRQAGSGTLTNIAATKALTNFSRTIITNTGVSLYTVPAGATYLLVEIFGAGAGGGAVDGAASAAAAGGGGGAGAYCATNIGSPAASYIVTVGLRGMGGSTPSNTGTNGGSTLFTNIMTAAGGSGGIGKANVAGVSITMGGAGAAQPTTGNVFTGGQPGANGICVSAALAISGAGGPSRFGGGGVGTTAGAGGNATGFGAGGGGGAVISNADNRGGDGSNGIIIITEYYK